MPRDESRKRRQLTRRQPDEANDLLDQRFEKSYLRFTDGSLDEIPEVRAVTRLRDYAARGRRLHPVSRTDIASKLPRLRYFNAFVYDNEKCDLTLRKRNRNEFALSLNRWPPLEEFRLEFYNQPPADERFSPPDLIGRNPEDLLSMHLRTFSQGLTELFLENVVVGTELFWPINNNDDTQLPHWPNLTFFFLRYRIVTPSGHWLFERDPEEPEFGIDYGEDPSLYLQEHQLPPLEDRFPKPFRRKASPILMNAFYLAAARAAQNMPKLRDMKLEAEHNTGLRHWFSYQVKAGIAVATWTSTPLFEPDERVLEAWRAAAWKHTGLELEVKLVERGF